MHLLIEEELAYLWRVHPTTPRLWWKLPFFDEHMIDDHAYYTCTASDAEGYMRSVARGFGTLPIPTIAELIKSGGLLTSQEASDLLGLKVGGLGVLVSKGVVPVFQLASKSHRYPAKLLAQLVEQQARECVDLSTAKLVLCLSREPIRLLIEAGRLRKTTKLGGGKRLYVTRESHDSLLRDLLPNHVLTEQWWEERLLKRAPLWNTRRTGEAWHIDPVGVVPLLDTRRLPYISSPGGNLLIPEWVAELIAEERRALTPAEIELIFGVSPQTATGWVQGRILCGDNHGGRAKETACPSQLCIAAYLLPRLVVATKSPEDWIRETLKIDTKAIRVQALLDGLYEVTWKDVMDLAESGTIQVLRLSYGDHVITRADALYLKRLDQQRMRTMDGPDYHGEYT